MATSGTIGRTTFDVMTLIEHATRRAGMQASMLSGEQIRAAKQNLFLVLTDLVNQGAQLWCIDQVNMGLSTRSNKYVLPNGTVDVLSAVYRTLQQVSGTSSGAGASYTTAFGTSSEVYNYGFKPGASGSWNLILESSDDNSTWTTVHTYGTIDVVDSEWVWTDIQPVPTAAYLRLREVSTVPQTITIDEVYAGNTPNDVVITRLNIDQYQALPNKNAPGRPYQYYLDRQITPVMYVWQVPDDEYAQIVFQRLRQIQDIGAFTNTVDMPMRWTEAVICLLAVRMLMELPSVDLSRVELLQSYADRHIMGVLSEERDNSPIILAPDIGVYNA